MLFILSPKYKLMNSQFFRFILYASIGLMPCALLSQTKPSNTKAGNNQTSQKAQYSSQQIATIKIQVDSLRKLGFTQEEITEQLLLKSPGDKKLLLYGLRKSPNAKVSTGNTRPTQTNSSTMSADEMADAVEIFRCFSPHTTNGNIDEELLTMVTDEFSIPTLDYLLQILDAGLYLEYDRNVYQHISLIARWLQNGRQAPGGAAPAFPAPDWSNQFNAILALYVRKQIEPGIAFDQFLGQRTMASQFDIFLPTTRPERINRLLQSIGASYAINEQMILRSCIEVNGQTTPNSWFTFGLRTVRNNLGSTFARSAVYWAQVLKLDNVPTHSRDVVYPMVSSSDATTALLANGYTNQEVLAAIREVYQD
jgi:DNA-binding transcriptional MerR regulator